MNKKLLALLAAVLMLAATATTVSADTQTVFIPAGFVDQAHYNVVNGQSNLVIGYFFKAAEYTLVQDFIDCVEFTVTLTRLDRKITYTEFMAHRPYQYSAGAAALTDEVVLELTPEIVRGLWSDPSATVNINVFASPLTQSWASWKFPIDDLPPGDYMMRTEVTFPHALSAGCDRDGDGIIDIYLPEEYSKTYVATIHVAG